MNSLRIATQSGRKNFRPGEELSGAAGWAVENTPKSAEVRLFWYTAGKARAILVCRHTNIRHPQTKTTSGRSFRIATGSLYFFRCANIADLGGGVAG